MTWRVAFERSARAELASLDRTVQARIVRALGRLAADPQAAANVAKLQGRDNEYRLRVGDWRVVYTVHEDVLMVLVVRVAHRREVYR